MRAEVRGVNRGYVGGREGSGNKRVQPHQLCLQRLLLYLCIYWH